MKYTNYFDYINNERATHVANDITNRNYKLENINYTTRLLDLERWKNKSAMAILKLECPHWIAVQTIYILRATLSIAKKSNA